MRIPLIFLIFISLPSAASTCGLFQVEDFGDRILYSLTEIPRSGQQIRNTIQNPENLAVRSMLRGFCYCVDADATPDPEFGGDPSYQSILVRAVLYGPYRDCMK